MSAAKQKPLPKPELVLRSAKLFRVACACSTHDALVPKPNDASAPPPLSYAHEPAWVPGLYILWAIKPPPGERADFRLGVTDESGYCNEASSAGDGATSSDSHKLPELTADCVLLAWFLRCNKSEAFAWAADLERAYSDRHEGGSPAPPQPGLLDVNAEPNEIKVAGGASQDKPVLTFREAPNGVREPVIRIPAQASLFQPRGPKDCGGFRIYRGPLWQADGLLSMPFAACNIVQSEIRKLQAQLGALRYPIGDGAHPYVPSFIYSKLPNERRFDVATWNALIAFQDDARSARAGTVPSEIMQRAVAAGKKSAAEAFKEEIADKTPERTGLKLSDTAISWSFYTHRGSAGLMAPEPLLRGEACEATMATIKKWIEGVGGTSYFKPGEMLVAASNTDGMGPVWLRGDVAQKFEEWSKDVMARGFQQGVLVNHGYRDLRVDALGAGFGRAKCSIHKTGMAADLRMSHFMPNAGLWDAHLEREDDAGRYHFKLLGSVAALPPDADPKYYIGSFGEFRCDPLNPDGGEVEVAKGLYLDITKVGEDHGFKRISAMGAKGDNSWQKRSKTFSFAGHDGPKQFSAFLGELAKIYEMGQFLIAQTVPPGGDARKPPKERKPSAAVELFFGEGTYGEDSKKTAGTVGDYPASEISACAYWLNVKGSDPKTFGRRFTYFEKAVKADSNVHRESQAQQFFKTQLGLNDGSKKQRKGPLAGHKIVCIEIDNPTVSKTITLPANGDTLKVGDGENQLPKKSFFYFLEELDRFREKHLGAKGLANQTKYGWVHFPQTVADTIAMEWWHYQQTGAFVRKPPKDQETILKAKAANKAAEVALKAGKKGTKELEELKRAKTEAGYDLKLTTGIGWFELVEQIGWKREALEAMGYDALDFKHPAS